MGCIGMGSCGSSSAVCEYDNTTPNPNPWRFNIIEQEVINSNTLMLVHYPNCTTFEGKKILLLKGIHSSFQKLDPHFFDDLDHPVIARFIPNEDGYAMAVAAANVY